MQGHNLMFNAQMLFKKQLRHSYLQIPWKDSWMLVLYVLQGTQNITVIKQTLTA